MDALGQHVDTRKGGVARLVEALEEPRLGIRSAVPLEQRVDFLKPRGKQPRVEASGLAVDHNVGAARALSAHQLRSAAIGEVDVVDKDPSVLAPVLWVREVRQILVAGSRAKRELDDALGVLHGFSSSGRFLQLYDKGQARMPLPFSFLQTRVRIRDMMLCL